MYEMVLPFVGISFNIKIGDALNILSWPYDQAHCVYPAMFKAAITQLSPEIRGNVDLIRYVESLRYRYMLPETRRDVV